MTMTRAERQFRCEKCGTRGYVFIGAEEHFSIEYCDGETCEAHTGSEAFHVECALCRFTWAESITPPVIVDVSDAEVEEHRERMRRAHAEQLRQLGIDVNDPEPTKKEHTH